MGESNRLSGSLARDLAGLKARAGRSDDWIIRRFRMGGPNGREAALVYVQAMVNEDLLQRDVLGRLMGARAAALARNPDVAALAAAHIPVASCTALDRLDALREKVARGQPVVLVEGARQGLALGLEGGEERGVEAPPNETGLRGPRDGLVENLHTNLVLLRRRVTDPSFRVEIRPLGKRTRTRVALVFLADLAPPELVRKVRRRLQSIEYEGLLDAGQLGQLLLGHPMTPFPLIQASERPDVILAALLAGRVAILADGSPTALLAPAVFLNFLLAPDDYYVSPLVTLLVRVGRLAGLLAVVYLPSFFVAVELYNPGILRSSLVLFMASERIGLPLGAATEIVFVELMMEMIHEATLRLPSKVGSAATVVGGLIVGQAAVAARLLSSLVIIIVAVGAIGSFTLPSQEMARVWRAVKWVTMFAGMVLGLYGVFIATVCLLLYMNTLDSFGVPYLAPMSPVLRRDLARDFLHRLPWRHVNRRPEMLAARDPTRGPGLRRRQPR